MRLISLEIENFLKFERLALEFPDGLTGILGPNGAGKSSLVEAIAWALYGSVVSRAKNEGIPFRRNVPCRVQLHMEIGGDEYHIVRELRGSSFTAGAEVAVNGVPAEVGTERVTRFIEGRLRMNHRAFLVSYFARQKEVDALTSWEPRDRKRYILRMLGLERCERAIESVRRDAVDLERDLRVRQAQLPSLDEVRAAQRAAREKVARLTGEVKAAQAALKVVETSLGEARTQMEALEEQQRAYERLKAARDRASQELEHARREEAIYADRVRELRARQDELAGLEPMLAPLAELRNRKQAMDLAAGLQKQRASHIRNIAAREQEIAETAAQIAGLERQVRVREGVQLAHDQAEAALAKAREELPQVQAQINSAQTRLTQIKKEGQQLSQERNTVRELGAQGKCPTCLRVLDSSFTAVVQRLEKQLSDLRREHDEYTGFLKEDSTKVQELQAEIQAGDTRRQQLNLELRRIAQAEGRLTDLRARMERAGKELERAREELAEMGPDGYDAAEHKRVNAQLLALEKTEHRVIGLRQEVQRLPAEEAAVERVRESLPGREAALRQAEEALAALRFDAEAFAAHRALCRDLEARRNDQATRFHAANTECGKALFEQQTADERREAYDRQLEEITSRRLEKENLDELLALMQAFRLNLIGRARPALSARASALIRDLTDGKYDRMELDEDYNLWMYDEGEKRELRTFSGGENDLAHLCLRLAISELIGDASGGAEHGFLVLDEVLGSQDGERRGLILQALSRLSRRFRQILMITHVDDTKEMVEHVFELRETGNGSSALVSE